MIPIKEIDVDDIIEKKPALVLVDKLTNTNILGSKNKNKARKYLKFSNLRYISYKV